MRSNITQIRGDKQALSRKVALSIRVLSGVRVIIYDIGETRRGGDADKQTMSIRYSEETSLYTKRVCVHGGEIKRKEL